MVAALGEKEAVQLARLPPEDPNVLPGVASCDDVTSGEVVEVGREFDESCASGGSVGRRMRQM